MTEVTSNEPASRGLPRGAISAKLDAKLTTVHDLRVPMRDGVELALDLVKPVVDEPLPVVLYRTPYDKTIARDLGAEFFDDLAQRGYVAAFNDCRGRFNSDGDFFPYMNEAKDGHDVVEWIAAQEWCDGNVGMIGESYGGQTQWFAASQAPPHLKAIVPFVSPPSTLWRNEPFINGIFRLGMAEWMVAMGYRSWQVNGWLLAPFVEQQDYFEALPVSGMDREAGMTSRWWHTWMEHPNYDEFWKRGFYGNYEEIGVKALNITGWWDMNFPGAPQNFEEMRKRGATEEARAGQKLVIGGWAHLVNKSRVMSGLDLGDDAVVELNEYVIRFFDRWLKGVENGLDEEKPVNVFVLGSNEWRHEEDFPLPGTEEVPFFFHSGGKANSLLGDGVLSTEEPTDEEPPDRYEYDPDSVHRSVWRLEDGPVDDRLATARDDVLCYTTEPLTESLEVVGWVSCQLYAASSARDTDWHVRLVDVHPDGSARFLCHGMMRARFRNSLEAPELLEPGEPTLFDFSLDAAGVRFLPGHRIRVEVMSSWLTQWSRNLNTGADNPFDESEPVVAQQTVFHQPGLASRVTLPVVPPPSGKAG
ncbi:MAG TPA: CocE/NonD family hydrolase [Solirubrobacterales bacterium]|nr:CocE/NonD family hydrolase [Solirubrobacterales bacterium]